jgi:hypothetical protein
MSWISDVRDEIRQLRGTPKELRKFGLVVGTAFMMIAAIGVYKSWSIIAIAVFVFVGLLLILGGLFSQNALRTAYKVWMGIAFAVGWVISRVILIFLFYLVITPVSVLARLFGKKFIDVDYRTKRDSYWVSKAPAEIKNYEKMF